MASLNILLIGNGGREHALAWKLNQSKLVNKIYVAPGNGGTGNGQLSKVENIAIGSSKQDFEKLVEFAVKNDVNLVVPGPEQPLVEGIEGYFRKVGIPVFGPSEKAARMEGSKTFSKDFMAKHKIPTAEFENFTDFDKAKAYVESVNHNVVIKASGLAAGKGVLMPTTKEEAYKALEQVMKDKEFGDAGDEVVVEECLEGDELSILAFSDGYTVIDLPAAQDHKRIGEADTGLNTGGMGAYSPTPIATPELIDEIRETILKPTVTGMRRDGIPFVGMLFTGIMLTKTGPKVLEYNVRFGDPETQTVLPLLSEDTDLAEVFLACAEHRLDSVTLKVNPGFATTVVLSAGGYPSSYEKGDEITVGEVAKDTFVFHAGTSTKDGKIVTSGGRVIASSAVAPTLKEAVQKAYEGVEKIQFKNRYFRRDIAHRAFRDASKSSAANSTSITYEQAGVSVDQGNKFVEEIKAKVKSTRRPGADADIGGFGGLFDLKATGFRDPLLVGATDGVGTKLKIAQTLGIHDTVGIDLVGMNVNDLVVQGAEPLIFLDYFASGKLNIETAAAFVSGVAEGCIQAGCALVGGETAEMPGLYHGDDYDVNGTSIGAVERDAILPRLDDLAVGDVVLGIASHGPHSNGFSLIRKILEVSKLQYTDKAPWDPSTTVGKSLLTPTRIYVKSLLPIIKQKKIIALAHITGGGLVENVPRVLPKHLNAEIDGSSWEIPAVFQWLGKAGNVPVSDISKTLNMGIGMVVIVKKEDAASVLSQLNEAGEKAYSIGSIVSGEQKCVLKNTSNWY
ncbi:bifunctional aminoimidazole ribotide synthase/glycinamide ribotide synthase [Sugiyamaella lignohabitans]|uniref:Bifunctional aminoimidazole ribotide synthase/glycinamide ribotide synthase n=1 Tax=Sugiyamaella lignohabitans TaxID=796027 RepID=A0A167CT56_9ASCO|nr:bifunctional aminoimidazole ribotide synthase/glycinamide ribotide synthase [Sugiyamaella lignohabitans]ANB12075.1 bifunctional aminoimidazole ribotide synthase/glycinamide ribotide synthase [Sugiyamaella lignohabitans]